MSKNKTKYILTFGYGNRKDYDLLSEYLQKYSVRFVVDVRINPRAWSRRWYADQLQTFCDSKNVTYISRTSLGNISGKENWVAPDAQAASETLQEITELSKEGTVLLLCAEMKSCKCHRTEVAEKISQMATLSIIHLR
jgi:uncharacterized protein (DUF488 family)